MKSRKKVRKKIIFASVALVMIAGIIGLDLAENVSVAQASQNIFTNVQPYQATGLKVLEITPTADDAELGYFFPTNVNDNDATSVGNITYGKKFNSVINEAARQAAEQKAAAQVAADRASWANGATWYDDQQYHDNYLNAALDVYLAATMRSYGLIKPSGSDLAEGTNSEYLIYDRDKKGVFGSVGGTNGYETFDIPSGAMSAGHYEINSAGNGEYQLKDGYVIGTGEENFSDAVGADGSALINLDKNYIYQVTQETVSANSTGSVSGNSVVVYKYEKIPYTSGIPDAISYVGNGGNGNLDFTYLANQADIYYGYTVDKIVYLTSNRWYRVGNWIKEYVLGDSELSCSVSYTNKTIDAVTAADIQNADLIYISGTAAEYQNYEMSADVVKEIYNQSAINHKAVIMDYAIYSADDGLSNLDKLALLLWQDDQKVVSSWDSCSNFFIEKPADTTSQTDDATEADKEYLINDINSLLATGDVFTTLQSSMLSGYNGTFAVNNLYVYNHHFQDFQDSKLANFQIDALDNIANGDFKSMYTATATNSAFQSVLAYIKMNNEKLTSGKMTEGYVTPAIVIQYILCYRGEDLALAKNAYTVLEIQPTQQFKFNSTSGSTDYTLSSTEVKNNRSEFIKTCLNEDIVKAGNEDLVTFESITVDAFNTMQTDLITSYDVVYIGSLNDTYYEHVTGRAATIETGTGFVYQDDASIPSYNDSSMNGYVYYDMGDCTTATSSRDTAYSSRDLTEAKLIELKDYLQKDGLIIADAGLLKSATKGNVIINPTAATASASVSYYDHGRMDDSSNMYELFTFARGFSKDNSVSGQYIPNSDSSYYPNLVSEGDLKDGFVKKADLTTYLNRERVSLTFTSKPSEYTYTNNTSGYMSSVIYQSADSKDGKYYLDYEFVINNTASVVDAVDYYQVHYYQDLNADGRFSESEEKFDYSITLAADGTDALSAKDEDGVTCYTLNGGVAYKLRRQVPSDEGGIIDWCIKVEKVTNGDVYCSETGYTAIKPREKKYINILQIMPDGDAATINLEDLKETDALYKYLHATAVEDQYEITVRTVTVSQFQKDTMNYYTKYRNNFSTEEEMWQDYFNTFERKADDNAGYTQAQIDNDEDKPMSVNMLILGFGNSYTQFTVAHPINAIKSYIETNKPVLTSNNVVASNIAVTSTSRTLNYSFLEYFGQDRYGYTAAKYNSVNTNNFYARTEASAYSTYISPRETGNLAIAYTPGSSRNLVHLIPIAYTNTIRAGMRENTNGNAFIKTAAVKNLTASNDVAALASNTYVDKMNEGQISHYPYTLDESILLSNTRAQYFQLDLDSDSDNDGNSDIVVWYTLGNMANSAGAVINEANIYSATPGDGINNYYVYNDGNVTFTGFGSKSADKLTTAESQLFVNTLIAAYEAGLVNPTVSFYQTDDSDASMLESIAVPYDVNVTGDNAIDSSIQRTEDGKDYLYKFVNPNTQQGVADIGTKAYFKVQDSNMVKGDKNCKVAFYLGVDNTASGKYTWSDGTQSTIQTIQLNDNTEVSVVRISIDIYKSDFSAKVGTSNNNNLTNPQLDVGTMYGFYVPMSYLNDMGAAEIYIQADTSYKVLSSSTGQEIDRPLGTAYDMFTIIKQDLLKLD